MVPSLVSSDAASMPHKYSSIVPTLKPDMFEKQGIAGHVLVLMALVSL